MSETRLLKRKISEDVQKQVREYIERKWNESNQHFVRGNSGWLKVYLKEIVETELDLVDKFFSDNSTNAANNNNTRITSKRVSVRRMNEILRTLLNDPNSQLLSEIQIQTTITDEKDIVDFSLTRFLLSDLTNIVIDYSLGMRFTVGMYVDAIDEEDNWEVGEIQKILRYKTNVYLFIHYLAWGSFYDEFINVNSNRIRFLYNDKNQIICSWQKVSIKEGLPLDYRLKKQTKWNTGSADEVARNSEVVFAPAGTFVTQ